jgi:hypothetical protein
MLLRLRKLYVRGYVTHAPFFIEKIHPLEEQRLISFGGYIVPSTLLKAKRMPIACLAIGL